MIKYIYIAGLILWIIGMALRSPKLAICGIPTLYGFAAGFILPFLSEQANSTAYIIAYCMYGLIALIWLGSLIRFIVEKVQEKRAERLWQEMFIEELKKKPGCYTDLTAIGE
ncbi:MAG: hypothetical protein IKI64_05045 [Clostridia bacterium]|nr:hypothetical protein [Clostridia bacterium]